VVALLVLLPFVCASVNVQRVNRRQTVQIRWSL